jgi:proteasome lid subunit RPN8/RPN11
VLGVSSSVIDSVLGHCRATLPNEGCGLLVGDGAGTITRFVPITNAAASPTRFVLEPAEQLAAEQAIEAAGEEVVGVAHSHPHGDPVPSSTDIVDAGRYDPFGVLVHAVVDPQTETVGWFRIVDGVVSPESTRFSSG